MRALRALRLINRSMSGDGAEAMGRDAKLLLELKKLAVAEQATRDAEQESRFTTLRSRTPREDTSREFDYVDARWWDDSMVSRTPEKHYGSRVPVDPDGDAISEYCVQGEGRGAGMRQRRKGAGRAMPDARLAHSLSL